MVRVRVWVWVPVRVRVRVGVGVSRVRSTKHTVRDTKGKQACIEWAIIIW